ncbi:MAG: hypothetical protein R3B48_21395 [Kofleriaceae bacterium]
MKGSLDQAVRLRRLGTFIAASGLMSGVFAMLLMFRFPVGPVEILASLIILGAFGLLGASLARGVKLARWLCLAGLVGSLPMMVYELRVLGPPLQLMRESGWDAAVVASCANIVAFLALGMWLAIRAICVLLGRYRSGSLATARVVGATLCVVALVHLHSAMAFSLPAGTFATLSVSSATGIVAIGFVGWQMWHATLLGISLMLLILPGRWLPFACTALLGLTTMLFPLGVQSWWPDPAQTWFLFGLVGLLAYSIWWLRATLVAS